MPISGHGTCPENDAPLRRCFHLTSVEHGHKQQKSISHLKLGSFTASHSQDFSIPGLGDKRLGSSHAAGMGREKPQLARHHRGIKETLPLPCLTSDFILTPNELTRSHRRNIQKKLWSWVSSDYQGMANMAKHIK